MALFSVPKVNDIKMATQIIVGRKSDFYTENNIFKTKHVCTGVVVKIQAVDEGTGLNDELYSDTEFDVGGSTA